MHSNHLKIVSLFCMLSFLPNIRLMRLFSLNFIWQRFVLKIPYYKIEVHLKLLTGWKISTGPCGNTCLRSRTRSSTTQSRMDMLTAKGPNYFGKWELEWQDQHKQVHTRDISTTVKTNLTEKVESVNPRAEWELDTADVFVPIPDQIQYVDIM